jgi:transposase
MRFVATKTVDQLDLQALHRVRERLVGQRTGIINRIRAFLLDRGVAVRQGLHFLRAELPSILANRTDVLSPRMLRIIEGLADDWHRLDERIEFLSSEIGALACGDPACDRLMTVPGIGPIISSAMVAAIPDTLMQDRTSVPDRRNPLATHGRTILKPVAALAAFDASQALRGTTIAGNLVR